MVGGYLLVALAPLGLMLFVGRVGDRDIASELTLGTGLVGLSLLAVALVLPARIAFLSSAFGIEAVLRSHRFIAMFATIMIGAHLLLVFVSDRRGLSILDLRRASPPVWAATASTVGLTVLVVMALRRRRRQPRYEGWRPVHVVLASAVVVTAGLHVWFLRNLVEHPLMRAWFLLMAALALVVIAGSGARCAPGPAPTSWRRSSPSPEARSQSSCVPTGTRASPSGPARSPG